MTRVESLPRADPQAEAAGCRAVSWLLSQNSSVRADSALLGLPGRSDLCPGDLLNSFPLRRSWQPPSIPGLLSAGSEERRARECSHLAVMRTMPAAGVREACLLCVTCRKSVISIACLPGTRQRGCEGRDRGPCPQSQQGEGAAQAHRLLPGSSRLSSQGLSWTPVSSASRVRQSLWAGHGPCTSFRQAA